MMKKIKKFQKYFRFNKILQRKNWYIKEINRIIKITDFFNLKTNELNTLLIKVEEIPEANRSKISQENINDKN